MDIYIDIVYLLNLVITFLTLLSITIFLNDSAKTRWLFLLSLLISISTFLIYLDDKYIVVYLLWVAMCCGLYYRHKAIYAIVIFYITSFIIKFTMINFSKNAVLINGVLIVGLSFNWLVMFVITTIVIGVYTSYFFKLKKELTIEKLFVDVAIKLCTEEELIICKGFIDTGNAIEKDGKVVIFIKSAKICNFVESEHVSIYTVNGMDTIKLMTVDYVVMNGKKYFDVYISCVEDIYIEKVDCLISGKLLYWG